MENDAPMHVGVCWYREEQWERLKEIVADPESIEDTFQRWKADAEKSVTELTATGLNIVKVSVDTEDMLRWANEKKRPLDSAARAAYAAFLVQIRESKSHR